MRAVLLAYETWRDVTYCDIDVLHETYQFYRV